MGSRKKISISLTTEAVYCAKCYNINMGAKRQLIRRISIHRFRSFGDIDIDADLLNIYSGRNNSGKSNILKALNLFFNNKTSYDAPYDHSLDYNMAFKGAAGGKREIRIEIHFLPTGNGALKDNFSVVKHFVEGRKEPSIEYKSENTATQKEIDRGNGNITRQFTGFLNKIEYIYIPAVRDKKFIHSLFLNFREIIDSSAASEEFSQSIGTLSKILTKSSAEVGRDLKRYIGINAKATLSSDIIDVLGATKIQVISDMQISQRKRHGKKQDPIYATVDLFSSGDGIVMAYLVYFLAYLTKENRKNYIWGYEEPENSLEYSKVQSLASEFYNRFTKDAQIFITTHSPAFISLKDNRNVVLYRVFQRSLTAKEKEAGLLDRRQTYVQTLKNISSQLSLLPEADPAFNELRGELYLVEQANEIQAMLEEAGRREKELSEQVTALKNKLSESEKLVIVSEGNNIRHIKNAITALKPELLNSIEFYDKNIGNTGVSQIKILEEFSRGCAIKDTLFVFDCDAKVKLGGRSNDGKTHVFVFKKNETNNYTSGGIENLYPKSVFAEEDFEIVKITANDGYGEKKTIRKDAFLKKVEEIGENDNSIYQNFDQLLEVIAKIVDGIEGKDRP